MSNLVLGVIIFLLLASSSLFALVIHPRLTNRYRNDETNTVVRLIANLFVVMASLVLGLMINSAKSTYEAVDHNVHAISKEIILFDRALRPLPGGSETRQRILTYANHAHNLNRPTGDRLIVGDVSSEQLLSAVGTSLRAINVVDREETALLQEARQRFRTIVDLRWALVEDAEGVIPMPIIAMVVAWLVLIFASFGYRAPRNLVIVGSVVVAAGLIAGSIYLILDLDAPFSGLVQVTDEPLQRAIAEMRH